jgi:hypothetical protein
MGLPGDPSDHMEALLRFLLAAAQREVDRAGGFLPFGASMAPDGELQVLDAGEGGSEHDQLDALRADARGRARELLAVGICADVTVTRGAFPEAIRVELELLPYRNSDNELTWGERVSVPGERRTWVT